MADNEIRGKIKSYFTTAANRDNLTSGEELQTSLGKIKKWFTDLKSVAFSGSYNDLTNQPTIPSAVSITGAANGSGTFSNGTASIATNRRACNVGNTTSTAAPDTPWYLVADYVVPASNNNFNRITFLVQAGYGNTAARMNNVGILDVLTRINVNGTLNTLRANWILSGYSINTNDFVVTYNSTTRKISLYAKITESYSTYRFVVLAESSNYNNVDVAELWTLYNTRTGDENNLATLPSDSESVTNATSTLATLEAGTIYMNSPEIDRTVATLETETPGTGKITFRDKNNKQIGVIQPSRLTDGRERLYIAVNSEQSNSITRNFLILDIAPDGTCSYSVSDPAAFRAAIDCPQNKQLTNENLNNITVPGFYNATSNNTCTNVPVAGAFGLVVIHTTSGNYWKQYFFSITATAKPYFRSGNNGTWTAWKQESSDDIVAMTGYSKPATTSAIETSDTLNAAIGKLETALDGKLSTSGGGSIYDGSIFFEPQYGYLQGIMGPSGNSGVLFNHSDTELWIGNRSSSKNLICTQYGIRYGTQSNNNELAVKGDLPDPMNNQIMHNSIYRGMDLTDIYDIQTMSDMLNGIEENDLFLGDYFTVQINTDIYTVFTGSSFVSGTTYYERTGTINSWVYTATSDATYNSSKTYYTKSVVSENVDLMFAGFDYYFNTGDTALETHHAVLIPRRKGFSTQAAMNTTNTTVGGYYNSEMHQTTLPCYAAALKDVLGSHLLSHKERLSDQITASYASMAGSGFTGASSHAAMYNVELQLMSEPQVYGTMIWSSSANDVGIDNKILPVFNFINPVQYDNAPLTRGSFWLRSVASSTNFARCHNNGFANSVGASTVNYVRPIILFS